ncbi:MAG: hypothetical protein ACLPY1_00640 [Terracidiphilus sp.]
MRHSGWSSVLTLVLIAGSIQAYAGSLQIATPAGLSPTDTTLTFSGAQSTNLGTPVVFSAGGNNLTFSNTNGFEVVQLGTTYFFSAFPNGTVILYGTGYLGKGGPVTIDFSSPVGQVGLNVEEFADGPYTVTFSAYDGAALLGTYTANGSDPDGGFASVLSFEGVEATGGDEITSLVLSDANGNNLGIGPVTYGAASATPEPGTFGLLFTGLAGLGEMIRRRAIRNS